ncbi:sensor histidine kinase [Arabiibacter massiliensis]|uniref:sensor histidine kinase n=1 Tax=Arabiibacter massiliensis TaxID=1870985 RepID=UPI0009BC3797|nr:HAMP domain-containing sensor histidine kinase [Arabiibacter massiliensis]
MARVKRKRPQKKRFARLRERWRNASLKTSFMVYMLAFLLAALVLSTVTGSIFASLQNDMTADAYEMAGIYVYDAEQNALVPARSLSVDEAGNELFVQRADDARSPIALDDPPQSLVIESYKGEGGIRAQDVAAYDARARELFGEWVADNPGNPYGGLFDGTDAARFGDLLVSPTGYYAHTEPSEGARVLSTLFGLLTFLMFPLWFGLCIFAAARRFYRLRLAPGLAVLDDAAAKIADEDLDFQVAYDRDDELGRLAGSFETMRASLADSQRALWRTAEERKRLNAAFAHDLRTPLTILKGKIELLDAHLGAGDATPEQLKASAEALARQVERLERYVAAMSGLQKLEDRAVARETLPFDEVAEGIDDIGRGLAADAGKRFALSVSPACDAARPALHVDRTIVGEVAENLVGNAMRFARERVDARLDVREGALVLVVDDDGPGFSPAALDHGCAPFFSETPSESHFGLGLNIASLLCERHGGSLSLANRAEGGARATACFALSLPEVGKA